MIVYPMNPAEQKTVRWSGLALIVLATTVLGLLTAMSVAG